MRSESTSALGQPSETNPTFGTALLLFRIVLLPREPGELEAGEHVARLALHLLLELREHLLALLHVGLHQALHGRALQVHELGPQLLRAARVVAVHLLRLVLHGFLQLLEGFDVLREDRKSTRLNSSHSSISYAVFCLKKKKKKNIDIYT